MVWNATLLEILRNLQRSLVTVVLSGYRPPSDQMRTQDYSEIPYDALDKPDGVDLFYEPDVPNSHLVEFIAKEMTIAPNIDTPRK